MRRSLVVIALALGPTLCASAAAAQDVPASSPSEVQGLSEARTVARCLHEQDQHIQRLLALIDQAEQRSRAAGVAEDVRRDARASIDALVDRIRQHAQEARQCVESVPIPVRIDSRTTQTAPPDPAHDALARPQGTVHEVEGAGPLAEGVRVVRGERVDGTGSAPDASVRAAIRAVGPRIAQCYGEYVDRVALQRGELHLSLTVDGGRTPLVRVEGGSGFDTQLRQCVERAARAVRIPDQRGRSVYAYTLQLGGE